MSEMKTFTINTADAARSWPDYRIKANSGKKKTEDTNNKKADGGGEGG